MGSARRDRERREASAVSEQITHRAAQRADQVVALLSVCGDCGQCSSGEWFSTDSGPVTVSVTVTVLLWVQLGEGLCEQGRHQRAQRRFRAGVRQVRLRYAHFSSPVSLVRSFFICTKPLDGVGVTK